MNLEDGKEISVTEKLHLHENTIPLHEIPRAAEHSGSKHCACQGLGSEETLRVTVFSVCECLLEYSCLTVLC